MLLSELTTPFEKRKVITYNSDQTKALCHNKNLQCISENVYRGEGTTDGYAEYCGLYVCYPGVPLGLWITDTRTDYTIEKVLEYINHKNLDTEEHYLSDMKERIQKQDHFRFTEILFVKQIAPELENQMWESRKAFAKKMEVQREAEKVQREAEDLAYVQEKNKEFDEAISAAVTTLQNGGLLRNTTVTLYRSRYDYSSYSVLNYLLRKYGVKTPIKTQGWINEKMTGVCINKDGTCTVYYDKKRGAQCSQTIFDCIFELVALVKKEEI